MERCMTNPTTTVDGARKNFLSESEIEKFLAAARKGRHGARDYLMCLLAFRHGFRVSELLDLRLTDLSMDESRMFVRRLKGSLDTQQPMEGDELRAIKAWLREREPKLSPFVFLSERGGPFTRQAFNYLVRVIGVRAGFTFRVYPHMLRHSTGFALANKGLDTRLIQDFLGHRNIQHTTRYTRTAAKRFEGIWR